MAGWGVERSKRTACPAPTTPTGITEPMPPHSQGAERRTGPGAGRTDSRWALRAFVIGGLAGAAWLLTGAAAHAADRDPAPEGLLGSSLIGAVVDGDTAPPAVRNVLKAAAQPLESDRPAHRVVSSLVTAPARVLTRPAEVLAETLDEATPKDDAVTRVTRDLTGPLRPAGGPADTPEPAPVAAAPPTRATDLPAHEEQEPAARPAVRVSKPMVAAAEAGGPAVRTHRPTGKRNPIVVERHRAVVTAAQPDPVQDSTPDDDGPAPLQVRLGALSGLSTSGPGAPTEGGSAAVLPAAVGGTPVADHRLPRATDVEARRHDAVAPTVSPD
jgi:hypothetical protein